MGGSKGLQILQVSHFDPPHTHTPFSLLLQASGHEHSGGYVNGFDARAGSRAPPDDSGEAAAEGDEHWASHAEQGSSSSDSSGDGDNGGDDGALESNPFFTDQFLGVLRGSLQRQGEEALTDTTPPAEPRCGLGV